MSDDKNQSPSPLPPLPPSGEGWGEGSGISLVQLALLQRRLRAAQEVQIAQALANLRQPKDGRDGKDGADGKDAPPAPPGKQGPPGDPPAHQWQGTRLRFKRPDGNWGEWVDLRPKVAVYGGGSAWLPDTLPDADDNLPEQFVVKQNGAWVRATLAQMQGWLGGGAATPTPVPVTVGGTPLTVGGQLVTVTE